MVEDDRYCVDILQQIASIRSAADAVAQMLLEDHIRGCVAESIRRGDGVRVVAVDISPRML